MAADGIVPRDVWHKVSESLDPKSLVKLGAVSRTLKEVASDNRLWSKRLKSDYYGLLRTYEDSKDYRLLYRRWRQGRPSPEDLTEPVHYPVQGGYYLRGVTALKLSQVGAGALVAWSMGENGTIVRSDVMTCKTSRWFTPTNYAPSCLDILNVEGWVLTGGKDFACWDHRQSIFPIFKRDYFEATNSSSYIKALISEESSGQPRVLTAGDQGDVCLWDLRKPGEILTRYAQQGVYKKIQCLAVDPRHGTLIAGGRRGLVFWRYDTGIAWETPDVKSQIALLSQDASSIAVGTERMIVGGKHGVFQWATPGPPFLPPQLQGVIDLMPPQDELLRMMSTIPHGPYMKDAMYCPMPCRVWARGQPEFWPGQQMDLSACGSARTIVIWLSGNMFTLLMLGSGLVQVEPLMRGL